MTPSAAAAAWGGLQAIADEFHLKLVSPAPNWCGYCVEENGTTYNSPYDWLRDFFAACTDCRVDYIAVHFYMGNRDAVKGSIEQLYNQFHKPIWLTEFNMDKNGMGDNGTADEQRAFMVDMIDWMEQDPRIFRYASPCRSCSGGGHIGLVSEVGFVERQEVFHFGVRCEVLPEVGGVVSSVPRHRNEGYPIAIGIQPRGSTPAIAPTDGRGEGRKVGGLHLVLVETDAALRTTSLCIEPYTRHTAQGTNKKRQYGTTKRHY